MSWEFSKNDHRARRLPATSACVYPRGAPRGGKRPDISEPGPRLAAVSVTVMERTRGKGRGDSENSAGGSSRT